VNEGLIVDATTSGYPQGTTPVYPQQQSQQPTGTYPATQAQGAYTATQTQANPIYPNPSTYPQTTTHGYVMGTAYGTQQQPQQGTTGQMYTPPVAGADYGAAMYPGQPSNPQTYTQQVQTGYTTAQPQQGNAVYPGTATQQAPATYPAQYYQYPS
jgi:hypothetical protein